jgi:hypothetical protein
MNDFQKYAENYLDNMKSFADDNNISDDMIHAIYRNYQDHQVMLMIADKLDGIEAAIRELTEATTENKKQYYVNK